MRSNWGGLLLAAVAGVWLPGCNGVPVCTVRAQVTSAAGEPYRCVVSEDCPRSTQVPLCVTDVSPEQECIACEDTVCVRARPEPC